MVVEVALDGDLVLDVWSLDDDGDTDIEITDELVLIADDDDDVPGFVDGKGKREDDFDVEYLLELVLDVAVFVFVDKVDVLGLIKDDEGF